MKADNGKEIIYGNVPLTFLKFTIPNVIGFIAMSSSGIVGGIFVGRYVGPEALAAVNIVIPIFTFVFGIAIMLTIGGAVRVGKYLGENDNLSASRTFTKIIAVISAIALIMTAVCALFNETVVALLGANEELKPISREYLRTLSAFFFFQAMEYALSVFVRVDGRPYLASSAVLAGAVINALLNWLFVIKLGWGVAGSALATGTAFTVSFLILSTHFISGRNKLRLVKKTGSWKEILSAAYNGSSELLSEVSAGVVALMFNWIMITKIGTQGVAAFTFINYAIWAGGMLCYAVGDSIVPLVSINYGARKPDRIKKFMGLALGSVFAIGTSIFVIMTLIPDKMIAVFLPDKSSEAFQIALVFASYIRWVFFFSGLNIIFSAYFTAMHRPLESVIIAGSRGLVLPVALVFLLPFVFGVYGIYAALPIAEVSTLAAAIFLWKINSPSKRIERSLAM